MCEDTGTIEFTGLDVASKSWIPLKIQVVSECACTHVCCHIHMKE